MQYCDINSGVKNKLSDFSSDLNLSNNNDELTDLTLKTRSAPVSSFDSSFDGDESENVNDDAQMVATLTTRNPNHGKNKKPAQLLVDPSLLISTRSANLDEEHTSTTSTAALISSIAEKLGLQPEVLDKFQNLNPHYFNQDENTNPVEINYINSNWQENPCSFCTRDKYWNNDLSKLCYIAHPDRTDQYYTCQNGEATLRKCPKFLVYDDRYKRCYFRSRQEEKMQLKKFRESRGRKKD